MYGTKAVFVAIAAIVLIGGVAAVGAASPVDQVNDNVTDTYTENVSNEAGDTDTAEENASDDASDVDAVDEERGAGDVSVGPSDGLPAQVPDFVNDIHHQIESFLDGSIDNLGKTLGDMLGGGDGAAGNGDSPSDPVGDA